MMLTTHDCALIALVAAAAGGVAAEPGDGAAVYGAAVPAISSKCTAAEPGVFRMHGS